MAALRRLALAGLVVLAACQDEAPTTPSPLDLSEVAEAGAAGAGHVAVMSQNVYIGFNADAALAALATQDPAVFGPVLQEAIATLQATDFRVRAGAIADAIARARPHAVGLQEVYSIYADLAPLGVPVVIDVDYLDIMRAAIADRGLSYAVVATVTDTDMQPMPGIRLLDREALLLDTTRVTLNGAVIAKTFEYNIGPLAPGVDKKAGYIAAPVVVEGRPVTIVTTHLESDVGPASHPLVAQLRAAQALEIVTVLGGAAAVVVGDLNDDPGSLMYQVFAGYGFEDLWVAAHPGAEGNTADCVGPALADQLFRCGRRIDFAFARGFESGVAGAALLGVTPSARVLGPAGLLWPSDHAGLVGRVLLPRPLAAN